MADAIFVTYRGYLERPFGGVQICTREYIEIIKAVGIVPSFCVFEGDRRLSTRLLRQFNSSAYFRPAEPEIIDAIARLAVEKRPEFVFLNQGDIAQLAKKIRKFLPFGCKIVLLSHGLSSTDLLHFIRARRRLPLRGRIRPSSAFLLGKALLEENALRADVDVVCTLSPFDVELERWLGAKRVGWLPRVVISAPIDWHPSGDRLGYIGTLDHAPNLEGLVIALDELMSRQVRNVRIRIAGGPDETGRWLAQKYSIVDYLGQIDDRALVAEAATWNAVINPVFCYARGCSTKLATVIGWRIPVVTTTMGHRGYEWREGGPILANDPGRFAEESLALLNFDAAVAARRRVVEMAHSSPGIGESAARFRALLDHCS